MRAAATVISFAEHIHGVKGGLKVQSPGIGYFETKLQLAAGPHPQFNSDLGLDAANYFDVVFLEFNPNINVLRAKTNYNSRDLEADIVGHLSKRQKFRLDVMSKIEALNQRVSTLTEEEQERVKEIHREAKKGRLPSDCPKGWKYLVRQESFIIFKVIKTVTGAYQLVYVKQKGGKCERVDFPKLNKSNMDDVLRRLPKRLRKHYGKQSSELNAEESLRCLENILYGEINTATTEIEAKKRLVARINKPLIVAIDHTIGAKAKETLKSVLKNTEVLPSLNDGSLVIQVYASCQKFDQFGTDTANAGRIVVFGKGHYCNEFKLVAKPREAGVCMGNQKVFEWLYRNAHDTIDEYRDTISKNVVRLMSSGKPSRENKYGLRREVWGVGKHGGVPRLFGPAPHDNNQTSFLSIEMHGNVERGGPISRDTNQKKYEIVLQMIKDVGTVVKMDRDKSRTNWEYNVYFNLHARLVSLKQGLDELKSKVGEQIDWTVSKEDDIQLLMSSLVDKLEAGSRLASLDTTSMDKRLKMEFELLSFMIEGDILTLIKSSKKFEKLVGSKKNYSALLSSIKEQLGSKTKQMSDLSLMYGEVRRFFCESDRTVETWKRINRIVFRFEDKPEDSLLGFSRAVKRTCELAAPIELVFDELAQSSMCTVKDYSDIMKMPMDQRLNGILLYIEGKIESVENRLSKMGAPVKAGRSRLSEIQTNMGLRSSFGFRTLHYTLIEEMVRITPGLEGIKELEQFASAFKAVNTMYTHLYNVMEKIDPTKKVSLADIHKWLYKTPGNIKRRLLSILHEIEKLRTDGTWSSKKDAYRSQIIELYGIVLEKNISHEQVVVDQLFGVDSDLHSTSSA